jgi:hypothetical protein
VCLIARALSVVAIRTHVTRCHFCRAVWVTPGNKRISTLAASPPWPVAVAFRTQRISRNALTRSEFVFCACMWLHVVCMLCLSVASEASFERPYPYIRHHCGSVEIASARTPLGRAGLVQTRCSPWCLLEQRTSREEGKGNNITVTGVY